MNNYDIIIIGAGSIGVPLSYYLARKNVSVAVIEKNCSVGRGQNRAAIGGIRATHSNPAKIKICQRTIDIISRMDEEYGFDVDWYKGGYLFAVYTEKHEQELRKLLEFQKHYHLNINWIKPAQVERIIPGINSAGLRGGTYSPDDGSASPLKVIDAYYKLALDTGVDFYFKEEVIDFELNNDQIETIITEQNEYSADLVINAAGGNARDIGSLVNTDIPVYPDSHEGGITEPVKRFFDPMLIDLREGSISANYYFYQNVEGQIVFCMTPNPKIPGKDTYCTSEFLPEVIRRMIDLYPRLRNIRVRRTWRGLYPMTPDGFPIVGFDPKVKNLFLTVGMCGHGFMLGPGLGDILAEVLIDSSDAYQDILQNLSPRRNFTGEEKLE
ncbi:MAG: FAD-binding oxidoreductase [Candidatus Marinimicrobia bacterium]|nr:FAD-binding oxidoreductase [Candidatus Neomarinimicrobiota bacterium]